MRALLLLLAAWVLGLAAPALAAGGSREVVTLSAGWLFAKGDAAGAAEPGFDDAAWSRTTLPHTFNAGETGEGYYERGPGWYRRAFEIAAVKPGRRLYAQFDGAALVADVYLNGRPVCRHEGGHAAFRCDLTALLRPGRNVLAARVDNSATRVVSPLGGDFTVFGGLYRPVSLIEADALHFDLLDHGGPGVYARASEIGEAAATVSVQARMANDQPRSRQIGRASCRERVEVAAAAVSR